MSHRYSTALSHIFLAGTGIYCLTQYGVQDITFPTVSFGIIATNSILGVWKYGNPDYGNKVDDVFEATRFLQTIFALPCIVSQVWLNHGLMWEAAYAHTGASLIPLAAYIADKNRKDVVEVILGLNTISLGVVAAMNKNYFGVAAAVSFLLNYFIIKDEGDVMDIPAQDLFNYGMCFFAFFALRALAD